MRSRSLSFLAALICLILFACGGGTKAPPGEQYFNFVKSNLASMEYENALKNLGQTIDAAGDQPLGRQSVLLRVALLTAMADATRHMAETYDMGARQPAAAAQRPRFMKMRADYYGTCRVRLLDAMQQVMKQRGKLGDKPMPLDVAFPDFTGTDHQAVTRIKNGLWAEDADRYRGEMETTRNSLAEVLTSLVGGGDDMAKGQATFKKGAVQIDPRVYFVELSATFLRLSEIFDRKALNDPRYRKICYEVIRDNMDTALKMLETAPDKDLEAKAKKIKAECEKGLKALGPTT